MNNNTWRMGRVAWVPTKCFNPSLPVLKANCLVHPHACSSMFPPKSQTKLIMQGTSQWPVSCDYHINEALVKF